MESAEQRITTVEVEGTTDDAVDLLKGGDMRALVGALDWSQTPLGPSSRWPPSLRSAVEIMLTSRYPMLVWWGPRLIQFYNDAYMPVMGKRHPSGLGKPAPEVWSEAWPTVGPLADAVMTEGVSTWSERLEMVMTRNGYPEEVYMTFSYSPILDESGRIGGLFCACTEETQRVLSDRRLRTLRILGDAAARARTTEEACVITAAVLGQCPRDLPFTLLYLLDADQRAATLAASTGLRPGTAMAPARIDLRDASGRRPSSWPLRDVIRTGKGVSVTGLAGQLGPLANSVWPEPTEAAVVLPMERPGHANLAGFLVAGVSPRLVLDEGYRTFLDLLARQVATAVGNARAYEEERRRAEALAEIDRAKTLFFSNVSHEFRTPLTLMLGPLEELLRRPAVAGDERRQLTVIHRNGLRLLKLVNSLLDFSRVEAGRAQASYEPTDLAALTAELASSFRSACEAAGLALVVDAPPLPEPVHVDREMWEKIILNLVSNAFKFTFAGEIRVTVARDGDAAAVRVRDTGVGIPEDELSRIFERFHRVENARGRTHEGTGIGLALVRELITLHGGSVAVESAVGAGTTFTLRLPFGTAHLPRDRITAVRTPSSTGTRAEAFVEEALRWLPDAAQPEDRPADTDALLSGGAPASAPRPGASKPGAGGRQRVLLVDDNADMRGYLEGLLASLYEVETATDGEEALKRIRRRRPDLVLSDAMMPRLDGFGLLKVLRDDPATRDVPVVLLSARAGEEARVEGLEAGADDYLIKPFSARELLARVRTNLDMARVRQAAARAVRESEQRFRALVNATSYAVYRMSPDWTEMRQLDGRGFISDTASPSMSWLEKYIHPDDQAHVLDVIREAVRTKSVFELEHRVRRADETLAWTLSRAVPLLDADGAIVEWFGAASDVTARRQAEDALLDSEARLRALVSGIPQLVWRAKGGGQWTWSSPQWSAATGQSAEESLGHGWLAALHPEDRPRVEAAWAAAQDSGSLQVDVRIQSANAGTNAGTNAGKDGRRSRWFQMRAAPVRDGDRILEWLGTCTDVDELRRLRDEQAILVAELQHRTRNLLAVVSGIVQQTLDTSGSLADFGAHFDHRLTALGRVQGLLSRGAGQSVGVGELLRLELSAHGLEAGAEDGSRATLTGPEVLLPARIVQTLALALHELMTNAVKHGALGSPGGRLAVAWEEESIGQPNGDSRGNPAPERHLHLTWVETGVAPRGTAPPSRRGFGRELIEDILPYELDAATNLVFGSDGVRCTIDLPLLS